MRSVASIAYQVMSVLCAVFAWVCIDKHHDYGGAFTMGLFILLIGFRVIANAIEGRR